MKTIDGRCPVCKEWRQMDVAAVGMLTICGNCRQTVRLVPRSSTSRGWRNFLRVLIVLGGVWLCATLYSCREASLVRSYGGVEMPDLSNRSR
jgi:hypothetical protein